MISENIILVLIVTLMELYVLNTVVSQINNFTDAVSSLQIMKYTSEVIITKLIPV